MKSNESSNVCESAGQMQIHQAGNYFKFIIPVPRRLFSSLCAFCLQLEEENPH